MDIVNKIDKLLGDETTTGDVATNTAKGHIDVVGGDCPPGQKYCPKRKVCVPDTNEANVVGGSYLAGTTVNIIGSGQTRVVGDKISTILDLSRKNKRVISPESPDKTTENLDRPGLKFNDILGAYVPDHWRSNG